MSRGGARLSVVGAGQPSRSRRRARPGTATHLFAGCGGDAAGLRAAGWSVEFAANHLQVAIDSHSANFPDADHECADISNYDMRKLPWTQVLWASPECTWHSPAGGRKRLRAQLDLLDDYVPTDAGVRSRATAFDVIRATEAREYEAVVVENVVEFADWPMFDWWVDGMKQIGPGYRLQIVCVSAAHIGDQEEDNEPAPQWRDRLYLVFTRVDVPKPDLEPRPLAFCGTCDELVRAVQSWKRPGRRPIGKYGQQYVYRCPSQRCRAAVVEPFVLPAAAAIDWTDLGTRIGDRPRPLAAATMRRIAAGIEMFWQPTVVAAGGNTWERPGSGYVRAWPALTSPVAARTGTPGDGLATPPTWCTECATYDPRGATPGPWHNPYCSMHAAGQPFSVPSGGTWREDPAGVDVPMPTRTVSETDGLVCPPMPFTVSTNHGAGDDGRQQMVDAGPLPTRSTKIGDGVAVPPGFVTVLRRNATAAPTTDPLPTVTAGGNHHYLTVPPGAFMVKNYGGNLDPRHAAKPVDEPLGTVTTRSQHALVVPYRRGRAKTTAEPMHTLSTKDSAALVRPAIDIEDCHFRMFQPREHLNAQRFDPDYIVKGNKSEQTLQAGNAVPCNVAQWIGRRLARAWGGGGR